MQEQTFLLNKIQPPFRLDLTVWGLRRQAINEIDRWDGQTYSRVVVIRCNPVLLSITQSGDPWSPSLRITAASQKKDKNLKKEIVPVVERVLGLNVDLGDFYRLARTDDKLEQLSTRFLGFKPPRFPSLFEAVVNGIACQQLSLHVGLTLLNRLASQCGVRHPGSQFHSFPRPACLLKLSPQQFRKIGFSKSKTLYIKNIARTCGAENSLEELSNEDVLSELRQIKGVGRWTAEYALLRGLGRLDVFPGDDVGGQAKLKRWLGLRRDLDYDRVRTVLAKWQPFAGFIYFLLLLDSLERSGHLTSETASFCARCR